METFNNPMIKCQSSKESVLLDSVLTYKSESHLPPTILGKKEHLVMFFIKFGKILPIIFFNRLSAPFSWSIWWSTGLWDSVNFSVFFSLRLGSLHWPIFKITEDFFPVLISFWAFLAIFKIFSYYTFQLYNLSFL